MMGEYLLRALGQRNDVPLPSRVPCASCDRPENDHHIGCPMHPDYDSDWDMPGNDPYLLREVGTDVDRRTSFRGEVKPEDISIPIRDFPGQQAGIQIEGTL